ncbi:MAG TPA: tRNA (adenosine(37)-N6)-threonylcarbamoyltransferase complex dimerization subunit type 1 TsaB [Polyangia bacterium]|jgi:tRNA threonylcarbamoyladenosine biosynthesis protein TsaB
MSDLFLCLDTATPTARVAVLDGAGAVRFAAEATAERHSSHVLPLCAEALRAVSLAPAGLAGIACGGGPGSFTGLRVGLAVVKGLALPTGVPLHVVSSLQALALDILADRGDGAAITAVPCLDAGKGEVYVGAYVAAGAALVRETGADCRLAAGALGDWLAALAGPPAAVAGNGAERHQVAGRLAVAGPTAVSIGRLALLQRARGEAANLASAAPNYGRPPDITVKKKAGPQNA